MHCKARCVACETAVAFKKVVGQWALGDKKVVGFLRNTGVHSSSPCFYFLFGGGATVADDDDDDGDVVVGRERHAIRTYSSRSSSLL